MGQSRFPFTSGRGLTYSAASRMAAALPRKSGTTAALLERKIRQEQRKSDAKLLTSPWSSRTSLSSVVRNFARLVFSFAAISSSVSQNDISNRIEVQPSESNNYQVGFSF